MRILGVDIGSSQIKLIEIDASFGRYEIHEYHEAKLTPGGNPFEVLTPLILGLPKKPDRIAFSLRSSQTTFRNFVFPTKDKKAITSSVGFELEDEIPFGLELSAFDFAVLGTAKNESHVHVAVTFKQSVTNALEPWAQTGLEPDLITTEAWAIRNYLSKVLSAGDHAHPIAVVDIGASRTLVTIQHKGVPIVVREIAWGGNDLTSRISEKYELPWEQAEKNKIDHGFVLPPGGTHEVSPEQQALSDLIVEQLQSWVLEFKQIELTTKSLTHQPLKEILLTGGASLMPGLDKTLEALCEIPVTPLRTLSRAATGGVTYSEPADALFLVALSTALCLTGSDRNNVIQFRKGGFARQSASALLDWTALKKPLITAAAVMASFLISVFVEMSTTRTQIEELDGRIEKSLKQFYGQISSNAIRGYLANPPSLTAAVKKELDKSRDISKLYLPNPKNPLDFLKELSSAVPKDVIVDLQTFKLGSSASYLPAPGASPSPADEPMASLTWVVANPTVAERIAALTSSKLTNMNRSKLEEVPATEGTDKRWKLVLTGKPTGESYGK
jgi:type IV pilus assembly protein PilM